jgi:hypothetical protein
MVAVGTENGAIPYFVINVRTYKPAKQQNKFQPFHQLALERTELKGFEEQCL